MPANGFVMRKRNLFPNIFQIKNQFPFAAFSAGSALSKRVDVVEVAFEPTVCLAILRLSAIVERTECTTML